MKDIVYLIRLAGAQTESWPQWFPGLHMECQVQPDGACFTTLELRGGDVSLLHGVLAQVGALNLTLLSVQKLEGEEHEGSGCHRESP